MELKQSLQKSKGSGSGKFDGKISFKGATSHIQNSEEEPDNQEADSQFSIKSIASFSWLFWLTSATFALGSMLQFQFLTFSTDCLVNRFGYKFEEAKNTVALMPISSMIVSPFVAAAIGKIGRKPLILIIDIMLGVSVFVFMRSLEVQPSFLVVLGIVLIGVHYSIFVAIVWPSMTLTVPLPAD